MVKGCGKRETLYDTAWGHKWGTGIAQVYCTHNTLRHTHVHVLQMCYILRSLFPIPTWRKTHGQKTFIHS